MNYYNINHKDEIVSFKEATLRGLGKEKGLFVPEYIPSLPSSFFEEITQKSNIEIAIEALYPYVTDSFTREELQKTLEEVFVFDTPVRELLSNTSVLELFHGPTMAFKDVGARFMARCLGKFSDKNNPTTVVVATSGDTGSAVANGFYKVEGVRVVILFPKGKVSPFQEYQMTSLGANIQAVEVDGTFDDCQFLVKQALADTSLKKERVLSSANSINVARFLPQMLYYCFAYKQVKNLLEGKDWVVAVPSGNFGNLTAGLYAYKMGLPVSKFIAANNANDTFAIYLQTGNYHAKPSVATLSNAMDVGDPSNFVRIQELFGHNLEAIRKMISSAVISDQETLDEITYIHNTLDYTLDPHSAVGHLALQKSLLPIQYGTVLSTASPKKFDEVIRRVIPSFPIPKVDLSACHKESIENSYTAYKEILLR